ncbi:hypothetical protein ExPUPEC61_02719 [Escherichia coli]|nr:hypothetical protein ExPUPEC61_02719 [Escherichia coli]
MIHACQYPAVTAAQTGARTDTFPGITSCTCNNTVHGQYWIAPCPDIADINFLMCQVLKAVKRHYRITNLADIRRNTYRNVLRFTTTNMIFSHEVPSAPSSKQYVVEVNPRGALSARVVLVAHRLCGWSVCQPTMGAVLRFYQSGKTNTPIV